LPRPGTESASDIKGLAGLIREILNGLRRRAADDSGVAGLVVVSLVVIVAFSALSVFLNTYIGERRFERAKASAAGAALLLPSVLTYYNTQTPVHTLPCPDTDYDGDEDDCAVGDTSTGILPWVTLGLGRDAVVDGSGNFYTYVVSEVAKNVCEVVASDIPGAEVTSTYTGALLDPTDLALVDASGASRNVAFAIIGHGLNGLGATRANTPPTDNAAPTSANEIANAAAGPNTIYSGPASYAAATFFDDQVYAPSNAELQKTCETLTPGGQLNADISDNFDSGAADIDDEKFDVSATNPPVKTRDANNNGVALFEDNSSYLATDAAYNFSPTVRPVYVSAHWTPDPTMSGATATGFSIATRATEGDLGAGTDIFNANTAYGITFRFDDRTAGNIDADGVLNNISIRDQSGELEPSAAQYNLIPGATYLIEVYDNGNDVWMRITQRDDFENTAVASTTGITSDLFGTQKVMFINGPSESYIDDVVVGFPMLALEIGATGGYAATADEDGANGTGTGDLTLEAWIRPRSLPVAGNISTIVSKWDTASTDTSAFSLFLDGGSGAQLTLSIDDAAGTGDAVAFNLGFKPTVNTWSHVAVTYDAAAREIRFYANGVLRRVLRSTLDVAGIREGAQEFMVGAQQTSDTPGDFFHGYISDVRVWDAVRDAGDISDNFQRRLSAAGSEAGLVVNWVFDRESGTVGGTQDVQGVPTASAVDGDLTTATYSPILSNYFRPLSTTVGFCPAGTRAGPYICDFRTTDAEGLSHTITVPANLSSISAKVWGGGGGGYDANFESSGGSGGFSSGIIQRIGALISIAGQELDIVVGGGGTGSATVNTGGHGGGGSGIFADDEPGLLAGGGGGASYSNDATVVGGANCATAAGTVNQCGLGGNGAGATVNTIRANGGTVCGGRGGNNAPFGLNPETSGGDCDSGGGDPGIPEVYNGGGFAVGSAAVTGGAGGPELLSGGTGYVGSNANRIGAGGGGGGASGGEAGGFDNTGSMTRGYGGGGGSGYFDPVGVTSQTGAVGTVAVGTPFTDVTRSGTIGNHTNIVSLITTSLDIAPIWRVGCSIDGTNINNSATITSIVDNATITISHNTTGPMTPHVVALTVTCSGGFVPAAGGTSDFYYYPSYLSGTAFLTPGTGGNAGAVDGNPGAVVIAW
jgi:hypothetical protein